MSNLFVILTTKDYLDKPEYKKNYNHGYKNIQDAITGYTSIKIKKNIKIPNTAILVAYVAFSVISAIVMNG